MNLKEIVWVWAHLHHEQLSDREGSLRLSEVYQFFSQPYSDRRTDTWKMMMGMHQVWKYIYPEQKFRKFPRLSPQKIHHIQELLYSSFPSCQRKRATCFRKHPLKYSFSHKSIPMMLEELCQELNASRQSCLSSSDEYVRTGLRFMIRFLALHPFACGNFLLFRILFHLVVFLPVEHSPSFFPTLFCSHLSNDSLFQINCYSFCVLADQDVWCVLFPVIQKAVSFHYFSLPWNSDLESEFDSLQDTFLEDIEMGKMFWEMLPFSWVSSSAYFVCVPVCCDTHVPPNTIQTTPHSGSTITPPSKKQSLSSFWEFRKRILQRENHFKLLSRK